MPRRQLIFMVLACLGLLWVAAPALGERGPNVVQLRQAVQNNPQDPKANYNLGLKYKEMGRPRQAAKYLKEAIRLKPDYAEAIKAMASLQDTQGNYGNAAQDLKSLMKLQPKSKELPGRLSKEYNKEGVALIKEGRFADAEGVLKKAAKENPEDPAPLNNLGVAYFNADRNDEAAQAFKEAIQRDPNNADARFNLGLSYVASGNMTAAYAESLNLWKINPELGGQLSGMSRPIRTLSPKVHGPGF